MSDKTFNFLNKYYTFSKKYMPLIALGIFVILLFLKLSTAITFGIYFGLLLTHIVCLSIIQHLIKKHLQNELLNNETITGVLNDIQQKDESTTE